VEGYVRQGLSEADYRRFMVYSQGSCDETKYWLKLEKALDFAQAEKFDKLLDGYQHLGRVIYSILWKG
jgi:four helix bundle protein